MKSQVGIILLAILSYCNSSNILVMLPLAHYSHTHSYLPIFTELARRGHNVTMVSPYPLPEPIPNFHEIIIGNTREHTSYQKKVDSVTPSDHDGFFTRVIGPLIYCPVMMNNAMNASGSEEILNDTDSKFDMVVTETFFCQEPFIALGYKYGAIQVTLQAMGLQLSTARVTGNPHFPSYMPSLKFPFTQRMNFWERSKNTFVNILEYIFVQGEWLYMDHFMRKKFQDYPGFNNLPPLIDMFRNISLILVDNHVSLSYPRPYLPNVLEFGGVPVKEETELPKTLRNFMDESEDGVIYFSWGSHYKTTNMEAHTMAAFMSAFGKLKQKVLMKVEQESIPGKPDNVLLAKWFPQSSILAHPNVRLFVSHGGFHGMSEAIYHGVPILGTPIFADQTFNVNIAEEAGYCIHVNICSMTEEVLSDAIDRLLTNASYKENALKMSKIIKDRPMSGLNNAVYWIEYLLRHNGAPHLRSAAAELSLYQLLLLDVFVVWGTVFYIIIVLLHKLLKSTDKKCKSNKTFLKIKHAEKKN